MSLQNVSWVHIVPNAKVQLIGFADASEAAYAVVIYLKVIKDKQVSLHLLIPKTKITPMNQISLPRLELRAAQLLLKMMVKEQTAINCEEVEVFAFSDSTPWLKAIPRRWKTFIANPTSHIRDLL